VVRLNKYLSMCGVCSRRKADEEIKKGKVIVNGEIIKEPYYDVKKGDEVFCRGEKIKKMN